MPCSSLVRWNSLFSSQSWSLYRVLLCGTIPETVRGPTLVLVSSSTKAPHCHLSAGIVVYQGAALMRDSRLDRSLAVLLMSGKCIFFAPSGVNSIPWQPEATHVSPCCYYPCGISRPSQKKNYPHIPSPPRPDPPRPAPSAHTALLEPAKKQTVRHPYPAPRRRRRKFLNQTDN